MASSFASCVGFLILGCASGQGPDCPTTADPAVGCCAIFGCSADRGPTRCSWGSCYCTAGYCKTPAGISHDSATHCVARVPGVNCEINPVCYVRDSFCQRGLCMCEQGFMVRDDHGAHKCVPQASGLAEAVARNATKDEIELLMEHKEHSERMAAQNVAIGIGWLCGAATLVLAAGAWALRRRASKVTSQPAGYQVLVD